MPQSETSHAGPSSIPRARWRGWRQCLTRASAASAGGAPAAGYRAIAQLALDKVMQEST